MSSSDTRVAVLKLRVRLEQSTARAFDLCCKPAVTGKQNRIAQRLLFLVGLAPAAEEAGAHRLAKLAAHVYARTSDVLHGRLAGQNLGPAELAEWAEIVERLERVVQSSETAHFAASDGSSPPDRRVNTDEA